jgi:tRNA G26 N,N-dimethylase Trm1
VPLLSLSVDFYVRVFLRVYTSPGTAKDSATKLAYLYQSQGCDSFYMQVCVCVGGGGGGGGGRGGGVVLVLVCGP